MAGLRASAAGQDNSNAGFVRMDGVVEPGFAGAPQGSSGIGRGGGGGGGGGGVMSGMDSFVGGVGVGARQGTGGFPVGMSNGM